MKRKLHLILTGILFPVLMNAQTCFTPVEKTNQQQHSKQSLLKNNSLQDLFIARQPFMPGLSKNNPPQVSFPFSLSGFYREDFEGATFPPSGWQLVDALNPVYSWISLPNFPYNGLQSAAIPYDVLPGEDWLILPKFTIAAGDSFSFHIAMYNVGYPPDSTFILVSTTDSALTSFTYVVATLAEGLNYPTVDHVYEYYSYSLSAFAGSDVYVAIMNKNTNGDGFFLDRVEIGTRPALNAMPLSLDMPRILKTGATYWPTATVLNDGISTQSFPVSVTSTGGYSSVKNVTNLAPGATQQITFDPWTTPGVAGIETVSVQTQLSGDGYATDDSLGFTIKVLEPFTNYGWTSKAPISPQKWGLALASVNTNDTSYLFTMGGNTGGGIFTNSAKKYLPYSDSWVAIPNMPLVAGYQSGASYNNKIYLIGGFVNNSTPTNVNRIYDLTTNAWSSGAPIPNAIGGYALGIYHDSLFYCFGGLGASAAFNSVHIYNAASDTWITGTDLPASFSTSATGGISGNKIVVTDGGATYLGEIDLADPTIITWTVGDNYPVYGCWQFAGGASLDQSSGLIVFTGGSLNGGVSLIGSEYTFAYDVNANQWKIGPPKPTPAGQLTNMAAVVHNDSLYMVSAGGYEGTSGLDVNEWLNMGPYVIPTGVADNNPLNSSFTCYPNPFINVTDIKFSLPRTSVVKVVIIDIVGREVEVLCNKNLQPGTQHLKWDAAKYTNGIYFCRLTVNGSPATQKLIKY